MHPLGLYEGPRMLWVRGGCFDGARRTVMMSTAGRCRGRRGGGAGQQSHCEVVQVV
jgi:hypothetical protein